MRRSRFILSTASAAALPLAGCGRNLLGPAGSPFGGAATAMATHGRYFAPANADTACPLGTILAKSLKSIATYPDKSIFALLQKVAASKTVSAPQILVANTLLGGYSAIGNVPKPIPPAPELAFPADHGEHYDTTYEWRYITLSLPLKGGGIISVVMAFFRTALLPSDAMPSLAPIERQVYSTSIGVTVERPGVPGVQYAWPITAFSGCDVTIKNKPFRMVLGKNFIDGSTGVFPLHLHLEDPGDWSVGRPATVLDVACQATNPLFLQGSDGYVGANVEDPDYAWYYYSWPQQKTTGSVTVDGTKYEVTNGLAWMDHQWGGTKRQTSGPAYAWDGWSWFELQFEKNVSLTCAFPHGAVPSGKLPLSNPGFGTFIENNEAFSILTQMSVNRYTKSPFTTARYPSGWTLQVIGAKGKHFASLVVKPVCKVEPQALWMNGIVEYSEANCTAVAQGTLGSSSVDLKGVGYCEGVGFENPEYRVARDVSFLKSSLH